MRYRNDYAHPWTRFVGRWECLWFSVGLAIAKPPKWFRRAA